MSTTPGESASGSTESDDDAPEITEDWLAQANFETSGSSLEALRQKLREGKRSGHADYSYESLVSDLDDEQP